MITSRKVAELLDHVVGFVVNTYVIYVRLSYVTKRTYDIHDVITSCKVAELFEHVGLLAEVGTSCSQAYGGISESLNYNCLTNVNKHVEVSALFLYNYNLMTLTSIIHDLTTFQIR